MSTLIVTLGSEVYVKSDRTRRRFVRSLRENVEAALARERLEAEIVELDRGRLMLHTSEPLATAECVSRCFGVHRVEHAHELVWTDLASLADGAADVARGRVRGRTFAARVRRSGRHPWGSPDAAREIGSRLVEDSAGVDLDHPEEEVEVIVVQDRAWVLEGTWEGPGGLPLGTQEACLSLLSGGFDSPVATWMVMRRGCPVELLHIRLECAQSDHALAVGYELWRRWGAGTSPLAWIIDFTEVKRRLEEDVPPRLRQVVLKQLMFAAADDLAERRGIPALVTGEAIGQVSSQTLQHMAEIDRMCSRTVLRPLAGAEKFEIVERAHAIGTGDLSARAHEVCDLSGSGVAVAAQRSTLERAHRALPEDLVRDAVDRRRVVALRHWMPGSEAVPVVPVPPEGVPVVEAGEVADGDGPVALVGDDAAHVASRLHARGRQVWLLEGAAAAAPARRPAGTATA